MVDTSDDRLPPPPRRPEETALIIRGVRRHLVALGAAPLDEVTLPSSRRADVMALWPNGDVWIIEIKSSVEDFRVDAKWPDYRAHCDRLYFATTPRVPTAIFPADCGLIIADAHGADILRDAPEHRLAAATRKSLTARFARLGALRLAGLIDPALSGAAETG
jgi:hypothetical protein